MGDKIFKIGLLILGLIFLLLFYKHSQNNRYQLYESLIIDTRTGKVYSFWEEGEEYRELERRYWKEQKGGENK